MVLHPLQGFINLLTDETKLTISAILPVLTHIQDNILSHKETDSSLTTNIKTRIRRDVQSRYDDDTIWCLQVCMCLDSCFKLTRLNDKDAQEGLKQKMKAKLQEPGEARVCCH